MLRYILCLSFYFYSQSFGVIVSGNSFNFPCFQFLRLQKGEEIYFAALESIQDLSKLKTIWFVSSILQMRKCGAGEQVTTLNSHCCVTAGLSFKFSSPECFCVILVCF